MSGKFITLEGVDGAGKSTHLQFIAGLVGKGGRKVVVTREPGGTELGEKLRAEILSRPMLPLAETLLIFAARAEHVARVIQPALNAGSWVVCDRFTDASYAYQGGGNGVSFELIGRLGDAAHAGLRPDRTLLFDCSFDVARQRLTGAGKKPDRFEGEGREFFERVRSTYLMRAKGAPARFRVIDASQDVATIRTAVEKGLEGL
jgi:dTMP kinase